MKTVAIAALGAALGVALGVLVPGCGDDCKGLPAATGSAASTTTKPGPDYTNLVVPVAEISALAPDPFSVSRSPSATVGSPGAQASFASADGANTINLNIFVLPDAAAAVSAMNANLGSVDGVVVGGAPEPVSVGDGGTLVAGTSPDNAKTVTVLVFTEGKASVTVQFEGPPDNPVPVDFATGVGQAQDATIKKNLPA